uniref:Protein KTI12 homolog n=1 Tax=Gasterosteus aculeatus aculeatus TaxID=481459 RepID=A0AAQ4PLU1_GASAC
KTQRAEELKVCFERRTDRKVHIVGDAALGVEKNTVYADSQKEINVRASLKAEVERKVNKDDIVIAKATATNFSVSSNIRRHHTACFDALVLRFEAPESRNRWDSPLFTILKDDALVLRFEAPESRNRWDSPLFTILKDVALPYEDISEALFKRKAPPPNQSTQSQPLSSVNFLHELDKITQDVLLAIFNSLKTSVPGDVITVPGAIENIELTRTINMAELRKLRRQFISYTKTHLLCSKMKKRQTDRGHR